jgi:phytoene/squalene synthetase
MQWAVESAQELLDYGKPLCAEMGGRLGLELRAVWLGGSRILERIRDNRYDALNHRPVITSADKLRILFSACNSKRFGQ